MTTTQSKVADLIVASSDDPFSVISSARGNARLIWIGETHTDVPQIMDLTRGLMLRDKYEYFAWERYYNARSYEQGSGAALQNYLTRNGPLPAAWQSFAPLIQDLRRAHMYVLAVGTREINEARDAAMADHFFEEFQDRKLLSKDALGIVSCGGDHASKVGTWDGRPSMRKLVSDQGFPSVTVRVFTEFSDALQPRRDAVEGADGTRFRLLDLLPAGRSQAAFTVTPGSVWDDIREATKRPAKSVAAAYDVIVLMRHPSDPPAALRGSSGDVPTSAP